MLILGLGILTGFCIASSKMLGMLELLPNTSFQIYHLQLSHSFVLLNTHGLKSVVYVGWNKSLQNTILYTHNSDLSEILDTFISLQEQ